MGNNNNQVEILPSIHNLLLVLDTNQILTDLQDQEVSSDPLNPVPLEAEGWFLLSNQSNPAEHHHSEPGNDAPVFVNKNDSIFIRTISLDGNSNSAAVLYTTTDRFCKGMPLQYVELSGAAQANSTTDTGLPAELLPQIFAAAYTQADISKSWPGSWNWSHWPQKITVQMGIYGLAPNGNSQRLVSYVSVSFWLLVKVR